MKKINSKALIWAAVLLSLHSLSLSQWQIVGHRIGFSWAAVLLSLLSLSLSQWQIVGHRIGFRWEFRQPTQHGYFCLVCCFHSKLSNVD